MWLESRDTADYEIVTSLNDVAWMMRQGILHLCPYRIVVNSLLSQSKYLGAIPNGDTNFFLDMQNNDDIILIYVLFI